MFLFLPDNPPTDELWQESRDALDHDLSSREDTKEPYAFLTEHLDRSLLLDHLFDVVLAFRTELEVPNQAKRHPRELWGVERRRLSGLVEDVTELAAEIDAVNGSIGPAGIWTLGTGDAPTGSQPFETLPAVLRNYAAWLGQRAAIWPSRTTTLPTKPADLDYVDMAVGYLLDAVDRSAGTPQFEKVALLVLATIEKYSHPKERKGLADRFSADAIRKRYRRKDERSP